MQSGEAQAVAGSPSLPGHVHSQDGAAAHASQPPGIPKRRSKFSSAPPPGVALQPPSVSAHVSADSNTSNNTQLQQQQPGAQAALGIAQTTHNATSGQPPGYGIAGAQPWGAPALQQEHVQPRPALHPLAQPQATPLELVPAPADAALALRITKLAEFTTRNGPAFENQVREKQGANPEYAFLNAGEGSGYYKWCLFTMARQLPLDQPLPDGWRDPLATPQQGAQAIPQEVASGFTQVLQMLQGTQDSIKASSAWFLACNLHARGMAAMMLQQAQQLPAFMPQLHLLYLINDIFFSGVAESQAINVQMATVFQPLLPQFVSRAYSTAQRASDAHGQLVGLLDLWAQRAVYPAAYIESIKADMLAQGPPVVMQPEPSATPPQAAALPPHGSAWSAAHPHGSQGGYGAPPPQWGSPGLPANAPPPDLAGLVPLSEREPYDLLSFPAGLIPKLVKHSLKYEREYTPLPQGDIEREPPPERPVRDAYLQSRLSRFYAEVAQYRPGQDRAAYEDKLHAMGDGLLPALQEPVRIDNATNALSGETNMRQDGSYAGLELGRGGVGAHAAAAGDDDAFARYRQQRSGRYHTIMATKSTNPNRPPMGH